ncbi:MAG: OmpA family protein [Phycisphaeraceae bacterium]|nr:OmpA family protein [Phycisphaerae bacterium]MBX3393423.1 OmpA family protein [Phycisphaeraceae bacterium]
MNQTRSRENPGPSLKPLGVLVTLLMVALLVGIGGWLVMRGGSRGGSGSTVTDPIASARGASGREIRGGSESGANPGGESGGARGVAPDLDLVPPEPAPALPPPGTYAPRDGVVDIELSSYAGYAGLIAANGGLEPSESSFFAKRHNFKVRIRLSEEEGWSRLQTGELGASATTADVLAVFGRQFGAVAPVQIAYSRGADAIVVASDVRRINDLKGRTLVTVQHTEAEFFIRFLAQESGTAVNSLDSIESPPRPEAINLVFAADGEAAGAAFAADLAAGAGRLAGAVSWEPTPSDVARSSGGKARILATNRNLLIIADVLVVNRGFAESNPGMVAGLVEGVLEGNRMMREEFEAHLPIVAGAMGWDASKARAEMAKVHFSNLPENEAFFSGAIDMAGSFGGIYQSSVLAYGPGVIPSPVGPERFMDTSHLAAARAGGRFSGQKISIGPIRTEGRSQLESDPLLSRDIRFFFDPNSSNLDLGVASNIEDLAGIRRLLQVSPGSFVLLRGHVDDARVGDFRKQGGESLVRKKALEAMELSTRRAAEIRRLLVEMHGVDPGRIETVGRGWEEPAGRESDQNRRVEVQWHTLE